MKHFPIFLLLVVALILTACSPSFSSDQIPLTAAPTISNVALTPTDDPAAIPTLLTNVNNGDDLTRVDEQGMVMVEVTPLNLGTPADNLEFDVAMNTHSVDLSMDLTALATLTTDTGITEQATLWDAPRGGHHVSGKLIFPAIQDGKPILDGASKVTLTIIGVDAPSRVFEWELQ